MKPTISRFTLIAVPVLLALSLTFSGCGKSSTGNEGNPSGDAGFRVTVRDDTGKPLPDFTVTTVPATKSALSDSGGTALLVNIREGAFQVMVSRQGYPSFSKSATAVSQKIVDLLFTYFPRVTITVRDDTGRPASDAVITTTPPTAEQTTDHNGVAVFLNLPGAPLKFSIQRSRYARTDTTAEVSSRELRLTVPSTPPYMEILVPRLDDTYTGPRNITLSGRGMDLEDGELPDSTLVWSSDLDGYLGRGKSITVPYLRPGYHMVTLRGTDSDHRASEATVSFSVFDYQLDSYFPIPAGESWSYRYLVPEFYITNNDNVLEYWVLRGLTSRIDSESRRVVDITWDTVSQKITIHFRLTLSDSLLQENGDIFIGQTIEQSREWAGTVEKPYFIMNIATSYSPRYLFLKNVKDITKEKSYESTVRTETQYSYVYYSNESDVFHESHIMTTSVQVGDETNVQTDRGEVKAIALTIRQDKSEKKWYLSRGLGLVRLQDSALNISTDAVLNSASLLRFRNQSFKAAGLETVSRSVPPRFDLRIDRKNPRDMLRLHRFLADMCPR